MDCSTPGLPVHHQLLEFNQTHVHQVGDAIQPSHPLSSPSPAAFNLSQHQGLFKWVRSSENPGHHVQQIEDDLFHHFPYLLFESKFSTYSPAAALAHLPRAFHFHHLQTETPASLSSPIHPPTPEPLSPSSPPTPTTVHGCRMEQNWAGRKTVTECLYVRGQSNSMIKEKRTSVVRSTKPSRNQGLCWQIEVLHFHFVFL